MYYHQVEGGGWSARKCLCWATAILAIMMCIALYKVFNNATPASAMSNPVNYRRKEHMAPRGTHPFSGYFDQTSKGAALQTVTDYMATNEMLSDKSPLNRASLAGWLSLAYPPGNTVFNKGKQGGYCAVSSSNNCPAGLDFQCANRRWSKDAVGEALALSAVGSYYVPSPVEDANMQKIISLANDPVTPGCKTAGAGISTSGNQWSGPGLASHYGGMGGGGSYN